MREKAEAKRAERLYREQEEKRLLYDFDTNYMSSNAKKSSTNHISFKKVTRQEVLGANLNRTAKFNSEKEKLQSERETERKQRAKLQHE